MAKNITIKHYHSETANQKPTASSLDYGEIAINHKDKKIYIKDTNNSVVAIGDDIPRVTIVSSTGTSESSVMSQKAVTDALSSISNSSSSPFAFGDDKGVILVGANSTSTGNTAISIGYITKSNGDYSLAEGYRTITIGANSHAEGKQTTGAGISSHAEGESTHAQGYGSHAEGGQNVAQGIYSHVENFNTLAVGYSSHAEGYMTTASSEGCHAEGSATHAKADTSHAEGSNTLANGISSHAEGNNTTAMTYYSHAGGNNTIAKNLAETAIGQYNVSTSGGNSPSQFTGDDVTLFSVGNGSSDSARHNAFEVRENGNIYIADTSSRSTSYDKKPMICLQEVLNQLKSQGLWS